MFIRNVVEQLVIFVTHCEITKNKHVQILDVQFNDRYTDTSTYIILVTEMFCHSYSVEKNIIIIHGQHILQARFISYAKYGHHTLLRQIILLIYSN